MSTRSVAGRTDIANAPGDDRLLAPTRWVSAAVVPVLAAAFVILYLFPGDTMRLWAWMVCEEMSAFVMGGGYLAGMYFFTVVTRTAAWHRVGAGFVATTVFSTLLLVATVLHWDVFTHDHPSFWAWLLLYVATPALLPVLWVKNGRTDPRRLDAGDVSVPRRLRVVAGTGGAAQLALAGVAFLWPGSMAPFWPWEVDAATLRTLAAFVAFPAVTWLWFLFEHRWSSFRVTQQTVTLGLVLVTLGAVRARGEFRTEGWFWLYLASLVVAVALNAGLYVAMERRVRRLAVTSTPGRARVAAPTPELVGT